jgi:hypothetical protein
MTVKLCSEINGDTAERTNLLIIVSELDQASMTSIDAGGGGLPLKSRTRTMKHPTKAGSDKDITRGRKSIDGNRECLWRGHMSKHDPLRQA